MYKIRAAEGGTMTVRFFEFGRLDQLEKIVAPFSNNSSEIGGLISEVAEKTMGFTEAAFKIAKILAEMWKGMSDADRYSLAHEPWRGNLYWWMARFTFSSNEEKRKLKATVDAVLKLLYPHVLGCKQQIAH